jgi:hypothetical protein
MTHPCVMWIISLKSVPIFSMINERKGHLSLSFCIQFLKQCLVLFFNML